MYTPFFLLIVSIRWFVPLYHASAGLRYATNHHNPYIDSPTVLSDILRGVKMFPTKTSRDVGMVDCVSDATGSSMEKLTGLWLIIQIFMPVEHTIE